MSKVETLRCDICGKTYLSDEGTNDVILAISGEKDMAYNDICPRCRENIHAVVDNPGLLSDLKMSNIKLLNKLNRVLEKIQSIYCTICRFHIPYYTNNQEVNIDIYTSKLDGTKATYDKVVRERTDFAVELDKTINSRTRWIRACSALIGFSIVLLLKLIFG